MPISREECFLPDLLNFIKTQGHSARTAARATWDLVRGVLVSGQIPRWIKEMLFVAISKERKCQYCVAAHLACCRMLESILGDAVA